MLAEPRDFSHGFRDFPPFKQHSAAFELLWVCVPSPPEHHPPELAHQILEEFPFAECLASLTRFEESATVAALLVLDGHGEARQKHYGKS